MNPERLTEQHIDYGKQVKGSRYFRDYCAGCGEPIRVPSEKLYDENFCQDCNGHKSSLPWGIVTDLRHLKDYSFDASDGDDWADEEINDE